jgi:hypothetical protein
MKWRSSGRREPAAADLLKHALAASPAGHPDRAGQLSDLATTLGSRYRLTGSDADLHAAVAAGRAAVDAAPPGHPDRVRSLSNLGTILLDRFGYTDDDADLHDAVVAHQAALASAPADDPGRQLLLCNVGVALRIRYQCTGYEVDLHDAVRACQAAVDATAAGHPDRAAHLSALTAVLGVRFMRTGEPGDLAAAVVAGQAALHAAPPGHPDRAECLAHFGAVRYLAFEQTGNVADLDAAVAAFREAVDAIPIGHPDRADLVDRLETAQRARSGRPAGRNADAPPYGHPDRAAYLSELAATLSMRAARTGSRADLDDAVAAGQAAVKATSPDEPARVWCLANLGNALGNRFERTGRMADLDAAVAAHQAALDGTPTDAPSRAGLLSNLCNTLRVRFEQTGSTGDLDAAVAAGQASVNAAEPDPEERAISLNNFGAALARRFERTGRPADLDDALTMYRAALDAIPADHPDRPRQLSNLGSALEIRFQRTGRPADIDAAVDAHRAAVTATPEDGRDRAAYLSNLAGALDARFVRTRRPADLKEAVAAGRAAVQALPADHPQRAVLLANLGATLVRRYEQTNLAVDLDAVEKIHRQAAMVQAAQPWALVSAARSWGLAAAVGQRWRDAVAGFEVAVGQLSRVTPRRLARDDQEHLLDGLEGLGSEAAACCVHAGQPGRAVELLDQGRGVLLGQALDTRTDLTALASQYPGLAKRFTVLRDTLDAGSEAEQRRQAAEEFDRVIADIQRLPGFGAFLQPPPIGDLVMAATAGPVVIVNVSRFGSHALILTTRGVEKPIPLPGLTPDAVQECVVAFLTAVDASSRPGAHGRAAERYLTDTLRWLWDAIAGPVLRRLGINGPPAKGRPWPRLWWCVAGPLSLLPIHAAGHHDTRHTSAPSTVLDRVVSSYTPTVRALAHANRTRATGSVVAAGKERALMVAMPRTPGAGDLPGAQAETSVLRHRLGGRLTVLTGPQATHEAVLSALPHVRWVHFACHAVADPDDPSASRLLLADHEQRPLTVTEVARLRLDDAEAAFLSACSTARPGRRLTDEAIHLASAFQLAGYRHVIGTLWPVNDAAAVAIADDIYACVVSGTRDMAGAVHMATRKLRNECPDTPWVWASHIHVGG